MQTWSLKIHLSVQFNGRPLTLMNRLLDRRLSFKDEYGEPVVLSETEFYKAYDKKELIVATEQPLLGNIPVVRNAPPDLTCFPVAHSEEALRRRKYLDALLAPGESALPSNGELASRLKTIAESINDIKRPPSPSTVRRWSRLYHLSKCIIRLVPAHCKKGRASLILGELEDLLFDTLNEHFLKLERPGVSPLYKAFLSRIDQVNLQRLPSQRLEAPSEMTVRRYVDRLDPYLLDCERLGKYAADKKHRAAIGRLKVDSILDRWEIDHTLMDVLLVDSETGEVIGRPYITVVLDRRSRMVMGFLIHLAAPNTESVLRVIERAIRPKHVWLARFPKVQNEWRARGQPLRLVPDNAAEFHADDLIQAFNELGIEILYPRSRGPQMKGGVERFFRTLNTGLLHNLPGTTFSNSAERGDYPSEKLACITLSELEAMVLKWIVDVYHQRPHRGLDKKSPAQVWREGEESRQIRLPADLDALESILARRVRVSLHHYGVEVDSQQYHSNELAELTRRVEPAQKVNVHYRDELGYVWVHDPVRNVFLQVPNKDKRMHGLSRDLYKEARKRVKEAGKNPKHFDTMYAAYRQIMDDAEAAKKSNKLRQRRYAARTKLDKEGQTRPESRQPEKPAPHEAPPIFKFDPDLAPLSIRPRSY